jgi:hypothetical protein
MADVGSWTAIRNVLYSGKNIYTLTATTAVKAGQLVAIADTGVSGAVDKCVAGSGQVPIGVALYDAAAGAKVAIAGPGCVVYMAAADASTGVDAGGWCQGDDNTLGGMIKEASISASGTALAVSQPFVFGVALDVIAGGGTGRVLITGPMQVIRVNSS